MRISFDSTNSRFIAEFNPATWGADKDLVKSAGFRCLGPDAGWQWYTEDAGIVLSLKGTPGLTVSKEAHAVLAEAGPRLQKAIEASRAVESDIVVPVPDGLKYLPYQTAAVEYAKDRSNILIADQMGLGKCVMSVAIANHDPLTHRVLIVSPASLKLNWKREWLKWDIKKLSIAVVEGGKQLKKTRTKAGVKFSETVIFDFPREDVVIMNYDILDSWRTDIREVAWDMLIIDEAHYLKNSKTDRTKEIFGCPNFKEQEQIKPIEAHRRVLLTGTPILNKPAELWPILRALDPNGLGHNRRKFERLYCGGQVVEIFSKSKLTFDGQAPTPVAIKKVWSAIGASNLDELQQLMRSRFMIRRLKKDVLKDMPAKRRQVIVVRPNSMSLFKMIEKENHLYDKYAEFLKNRKIDTPEFREMSNVRKQTAVAKAPFVIDHLKNILDETEKVCVFAHHGEVIDQLMDALKDFGAVKIDGQTPNEDRQKAVDLFQTDSKIRVFVGSIQAAGVGLTLTAASVAVFAELAWTPSEISQAEDRLHRYGQKNSVLIQHIVLENSLDERQAQLIIQKQEIMDRGLDEIN